MTTHNSSSSIQVTNNFAYKATITINHTYDNSPSESQTWKDVIPATTTNPDMTVTYNIGFGHIGHDYWQAEVVINDGPNPGQYISDSGACTLHSPDVGKVLTVLVSDTGLTVAGSQNHITLTWATRPV